MSRRELARRLLPHVPPVPAQALAFFHIAVGAAILAGGPVRFSGPGWAGARWLAPWWVWGGLLTLVGALVLWFWPVVAWRHPWVGFGAVVAGSVPMAFLAFGFAYAVTESSVVSYTGIAIFGALVAAHLHLAVNLLQGGLLDRRPT